MARSGWGCSCPGSASLMMAGFADVALSPSRASAEGSPDDGGRRREVVFVSSSRTSISDEFEQLGVVHHVGLVEEDDDVGHAFHLTGQQDVLAVWGIGPSAAGADQDGASIWAAPVIMFFDVVGVAWGSRRGRSGGWPFQRARC